ncbi:hypothetical protein [Salinibacter altiplanensis]|uniref:hypothetical protein n=1 Tax=Salinibacter altiplanensis TaxID=1803181 RepID=UPI000C9F167D|nr:hypothetical protein [Salinibacter altiplanensis]
MKYSWTPIEVWSRTGAVLLASTALYLAFCVFCVTGMPVGQDVAVATGVLIGFPVWVGAMCYAVLARTALRAWGILLGIAFVLGGCAALAHAFL